ncbi:MAG: hypothetical protein RRZ24_04925 [Clostridia bacterium]
MNVSIKEVMRRRLPWVYPFLKKANATLMKQRHGERKISYGFTHPEQTFYVIRWDSRLAALGGLVVQIVLGGIQYAQEIGSVPIVDFYHGDNYYRGCGERSNIWEWYFE